MKFTDLTNDLRLFTFTRADEHTKKVQGDSLSSFEAAINYLFLTNAGGAVAVLGFLGKAQTTAHWVGALVALALFGIGVALVGPIKAFRLHYFARRAKTWVEQSSRFFGGEIDWEELNKRYAAAAVEPRWPYAVGYLSFTCFVVGVVIGFCQLWHTA